MSQALVRKLLEAPLRTWAAAQSPVVQVAWENVEFAQPAPQSRYLRSNLLPLPTLSEDLGRLHRRYEGLFQIRVVEPNGAGPGAAEVVVAALAALYPPDTPLVDGTFRLYVLQPLSAAPPLPERDRFVIPCSLSYRADTYP